METHDKLVEQIALMGSLTDYLALTPAETAFRKALYALTAEAYNGSLDHSLDHKRHVELFNLLTLLKEINSAIDPYFLSKIKPEHKSKLTDALASFKEERQRFRTVEGLDLEAEAEELTQEQADSQAIKQLDRIREHGKLLPFTKNERINRDSVIDKMLAMLKTGNRTPEQTQALVLLGLTVAKLDTKTFERMKKNDPKRQKAKEAFGFKEFEVGLDD